MINHLTDDDARTLLNNGRIGRLACIIDDYPYVVPVHYLVDGDHIYSHSLAGRKITALRANPHACFQVDKVDDECHWHSVIAYGTYEEIVDPDRRGRVLQRLFERFPTLTPVESQLASDADPSNIIVISIRIEKLSAVAEGKTRDQFQDSSQPVW